MLLAVREQFFRDLHFGVRPLGHDLGITLRVVDARDLARLHDDARAFFKVDDGLRVQDALAAPFALAIVLFDVGDLRVFADVERVDAVVLRVAVAAVVDAAARHDAHVRALADEKVVVDHVLKARFCQYHRDVDVFVLRKRRDADVDAVLVRL